MSKLFSTTAMMAVLAFSGMAYANDDGQAKEGPEGKQPFMEKALASLPEKDAQLFRDAMEQTRKKNEGMREPMHKLHDELYQLVTADKFDKNAYIAKSKELEKLKDKMHDGITEAYASALSKLPADERKTLADAMHGHKHPDAKKSDSGDASSDSDKGK